MSSYVLRSPVLVRVFNRVDNATRVVDALLAAQPQRVYLFSDGARPHVDGESESVARLRDVLQQQLSGVRLETYFSDVNLGCAAAAARAMSWFFDQEPEGIILEDDCVPSASFFRYCDEVLARYRDDQRVMSVSGYCARPAANWGEYSYFFSALPQVWGLATWRRAWALYDETLQHWPRFRAAGGLLNLFETPARREWWERLGEDLYSGRRNHFDYRWMLTCLMYSGLAVVPQTNLIENIGFGAQATNTNSRPPAWLARPGELSFPLRHPQYLYRCYEADNQTDRLWFSRGSRTRRWVGKTRARTIRRLRQLIQPAR